MTVAQQDNQAQPAQDVFEDIQRRVEQVINRTTTLIQNLAVFATKKTLAVFTALAGVISPPVLALGAVMYFSHLNERLGRRLLIGGSTLGAGALAGSVLAWRGFRGPFLIRRAAKAVSAMKRNRFGWAKVGLMLL